MVTYDVFIDAAHAAMPSEYYEELSIPGDGSYIVAPADGYFAAMGHVTSNNLAGWSYFAKVKDDSLVNYWNSLSIAYSLNQGIFPWICVSKNERVLLRVSNAQITKLCFIYCNGSMVSE